MGVYDTLIIRCVSCNNPIELQSKAGDCHLERFTITDVPLSILADIVERDNSIFCDSCKSVFTLKLFYTLIMEREG